MKDRHKSIRQTEHRVLARPLGRSIAETSDADAARQSSFDGSGPSLGARNASEIVILTCRMLHFSRAAICSTLVTVPTVISSKPATTAGNRCDKCGAGLSANRPTVLGRLGSRHDDLASPFHWRLLPWDAQNKSIIVHRVGLIAGCLWLEVDDQKILVIRLPSLSPHALGRAAAEIGFAYAIVVAQRRAVAARDDRSRLQHITAARGLQRVTRVLLDEEHARTGGVDRFDGAKDILHN
jgi:hypothetical protein